MKVKMGRVLALACTLVMAVVCASPVVAQTSDWKPKPPMYSYIGNWNIPRAQWGEMEKNNAADQSILDKAIAGGTLIAYGNDVTLVHTADGYTHDDWWSSMSMAGLMNVLDQFYKSGNSTAVVLGSSTRHSDAIFVSRCYNWKPGSYKGVYTHGAAYKLKADAASDSVETISRELVAPLMEKLLADGSVLEYEVDTEAIHTESPDMFYIIYIVPNAESLDKVTAALQQRLKSNPLGGSAFGSMTDSSAHRDFLSRTTATYK